MILLSVEDLNYTDTKKYIARPVLLPSGAVLLPAGKLITLELVTSLKKHSIRFVFVTERETLSDYEPLAVPDNMLLSALSAFQETFKSKNTLTIDRLRLMRVKELREYISKNMDLKKFSKLYSMVKELVYYLRKHTITKPIMFPKTSGLVGGYFMSFMKLFLFLSVLFKIYPIYKKELPGQKQEENFLKLCLAVLLSDISVYLGDEPVATGEFSAKLLKGLYIKNKPFFSDSAINFIRNKDITQENVDFTVSRANLILSVCNSLIQCKYEAADVIDFFSKIVYVSFKFTAGQFLNALKSMSVFDQGEEVYIKRETETEDGYTLISYDNAVVLGSSFNFLRPAVLLGAENTNLNKKDNRDLEIFVRRDDKFYDIQDNFEKFIDYVEYNSVGYGEKTEKKYSRAYVKFITRLEQVRKDIEMEQGRVSTAVKNFITKLERIKMEDNVKFEQQRHKHKLKLMVDDKEVAFVQDTGSNPLEGRIEEII